MRQDLPGRQPLSRVFLEKTCEDVACILRDAVLQLVVRPNNHFLQLVHIIGAEGHNSVQHGVQNDS